MSDAVASDGTLSTEPVGDVRVGVLSFHNSKETKAILNAVTALGHTPVWLREENLQTWIEDGALHFAPEVDVVANRLLTTKAEQPLDDLGAAMSYAPACPVLNSPTSVVRATHKYGSAAALATAGLPVPDAYMAFVHRTINDAENPVRGHAVHKPTIGTNGGQMSLVEVGEAVPPRIARRRAFLQQFIDVDAERPFDFRVYVVGDRIVGAMKRYAPPDEWRTNVALGGEVEGVTDDLPEAARRLALRATGTFDLDYAGVDLLCRGGEWYVLEVNATAGFRGLFDATGTSPAPYIARLAIERGGGDPDRDRVSELAGTLDDSVPECKSSPKPRSATTETIGYTERIIVSGGGSLHRVVAKADTGAKRTSVDVELAAAIGAGPVVGTTEVRSGIDSEPTTRPLVNVDVRLGGRWRTITASVEDRSHMTYSVLMGRDLLSGHRVDVGRRVTEE